MAQDRTPVPVTSDLKKLAAQSAAQAKSADSHSGGTVVQGPYEVGNLGHVSVVERTLGASEQKYLYAEFIGTGRPSRIPLAAVAALAEQMG